MYHRVGKGKHANAENTLIEHFEYLKQFPSVLPGDPIAPNQNAICLTFDDASYDFYHTVFPLLKKYNLRALLGVPVRYILEESTLLAEERLSVPYTMAMQDGFFEKKAPFCTWKEIEEMVASGHVEVASHSFAHCNLTFSFVDLQREIVESKKLIEKRIDQPVSSFIYPFGKVNHSVHLFVMQHYLYSFRIGSAVNWSWNCKRAPLCRIKADNTEAKQLLSIGMKSSSILKSIALKLKSL
ncbi:MAG: hypothetical protein S4CHLAM45_12050 [Chlamydiales bacterium]|nr:hypothetical protein [Chlamydiales bacterium]MCH9619694.1 hypothetical protein [Chlamydiales bacterium]MCH9623300.1 hypothetical protein [Chlamydiales bacterium]